MTFVEVPRRLFVRFTNEFFCFERLPRIGISKKWFLAKNTKVKTKNYSMKCPSRQACQVLEVDAKKAKKKAKCNYRKITLCLAYEQIGSEMGKQSKSEISKNLFEERHFFASLQLPTVIKWSAVN